MTLPSVPVDPPRVRRMDSSEQDLLLFKKAFDDNGSPRALQHLRWQYAQPPVNKLLVLFALVPSADRIAAIYATLPVMMKVEDRVVLGLQSLNTLTDEAYRGKGLFNRLASEMYEQAAPSEGVSCVYGFPNKNSAPGFFGKLKWTNLDPVPYMLKPLRLGYITQRLLGVSRWARLVPDFALARMRAPKLSDGQQLRDITSFDVAFDELWLRFSRGITCAVVRDSAYLNWRLARPEALYQTQALYERGRLLGFVTTSVGAAAGKNQQGHVVELIFDPAHQQLGRLLLKAGLHRLAQRGAAVAVAWNLPGSPNHRVLRQQGFITVPRRFQPIELHFGVRWFGENVPAAIGDRSRWYISYLDCDTA
jgi:GNAT superfamily N-acetyltransferase